MFNLNPRKNPTIPQNDTQREQKKRQQQLERTQKSYQWDLEKTNVVGIPMAKKVPFSAEPTPMWLFDVAKVGEPILDNIISNLGTSSELEEINEGLDEISKLIDDIIPGDQGILIRDTKDLLETLFSKYQAAVQEKSQEIQAQKNLDSYENQFKTLPLPEVADVFQENENFAYYRVAGPNPMLIKGATSLNDNFPVTEEGFQKVMGADDSLASALSDKRIYLLDYHELSALVEQPGSPQKQVFAPIAMFAIPKDGTDLKPVAIQCGQNKHDFPITYSEETNNGSSMYWRWQVAKTIVQIAEGNYHEFFVHLSRTHLMSEAFAVATQRYLAECHPINILLTPHFEGTLFINNSAAGSLIAPGGPIDSIFGAKIDAVQAAAAADRLHYDFYANMLPNDLVRRNVENADLLPNYPYRDDATLVWNAIHDWATTYISVYYTGDAEVADDNELASWCKALSSDNEGRIKGFKPITSRAQLADVLTMIIFTSSAQHAAVNFPQKPLMSFAPAISGAAWGDNPEDAKTEAEWLNIMVPLMPQALEQLSLLQLLGGVYYRKLGEYRSNEFPYSDWFKDKKITAKGGPLSQFNKALNEIEATINKRNETRQEYTFLLPSKIPPSINI